MQDGFRSPAGKRCLGLVCWTCLEPKSLIRLAGAFPVADMVLSGILSASVRILLLVTPRRSPLRLRLGEKRAA